ncbi:unnamed protein product [Caenorhabditis angaria]|uniref:DUF38 domain-containing protein n=1 Tax=Caenorhabditis angaria TaxID=860376 RepID=A0A9P1IG01_9PELO|nr:unnamed protein product [Caenorhabditis angaria]
MSKILIFLIIPAVLSRGLGFSDFSTTTQPSQDASILGYQFLTAFLNAARAEDYSIFAQNFTESGIITKELLLRVFRSVPKDDSVEEVFPRNEVKCQLEDIDGQQYVVIEITEDRKLFVFVAQILGENQFVLQEIFWDLTNNITSSGLLKKLI